MRLGDLLPRAARTLHPGSARLRRPLCDEAVAPTGQAVACAGMTWRISKQLLVAGRKARDPVRPVAGRTVSSLWRRHASHP